MHVFYLHIKCSRYSITNTAKLKYHLHNKALRKMPLFHLISWCGNFVERHSFRKIRGNNGILRSEENQTEEVFCVFIIDSNPLTTVVPHI